MASSLALPTLQYSLGTSKAGIEMAPLARLTGLLYYYPHPFLKSDSSPPYMYYSIQGGNNLLEKNVI